VKMKVSSLKSAQGHRKLKETLIICWRIHTTGCKNQKHGKLRANRKVKSLILHIWAQDLTKCYIRDLIMTFMRRANTQKYFMLVNNLFLTYIMNLFSWIVRKSQNYFCIVDLSSQREDKKSNTRLLTYGD